MAKYDSVRKAKRNEAIFEMRKDNPDLSLREIGDFFNISKARVSKILLTRKAGRQT